MLTILKYEEHGGINDKKKSKVNSRIFKLVVYLFVLRTYYQCNLTLVTSIIFTMKLHCGKIKKGEVII